MTKRPVPSSCARARVADLMITLAKKSTAFGEITILKSLARDSHVYCQGDWWQSEADRNGVSLAAYVHAIYALLAQSQAQQILMIGCGGGTLGTMLAAAARQVTIVDINPESILLAQQYFSLPSHITCHVAYIAWQLQRKLTWDPNKQEFVGDPEANRMRSREMREPWRI